MADPYVTPAHQAAIDAARGTKVTVLTADMAAITANQTVQDIPGLGVAIGASATEMWLLKYWMLVKADNAVMDVKFGLTVPSGATFFFGGVVGSGGAPGGWGSPPVATTVNALGTAGTLAVGTAGGPTAPSGVAIVAVVYGGGTAGTVQLRVAQNTSDAGALQILKGSMVEATKVAS